MISLVDAACVAAVLVVFVAPLLWRRSGGRDPRAQTGLGSGSRAQRHAGRRRGRTRGLAIDALTLAHVMTAAGVLMFAVGIGVVLTEGHGRRGAAAVRAGLAVDDLSDISLPVRHRTVVAILDGSAASDVGKRTERRLTGLGFRRGRVDVAAAGTSRRTTVAFTDKRAARAARAIAGYLHVGRVRRLGHGARLASGADVVVSIAGDSLP